VAAPIQSHLATIFNGFLVSLSHKAHAKPLKRLEKSGGTTNRAKAALCMRLHKGTPLTLQLASLCFRNEEERILQLTHYLAENLGDLLESF